MAAMTGLVGQYRIEKKLTLVPKGTVFLFKWQDGSSEKGVVTNPAGMPSTSLVPGSESMPREGGTGYTTDRTGNYVGGSNVVGFRPIYRTVTVCVSGSCSSATLIVGYEWIFRSGTHAV